MSTSWVGAIDIGGTKTAAARIGPDGELTGRTTVSTPAAQGARAVLDTVGDLVRGLGRVAAIGVGSAGVIDQASGEVRSATDALPGWAGIPLAKEIATMADVPVRVDNDVHTHAVGEYWKGAAQGCRTVLFVAAGTGVGGSLLIDGRIHHGANGAAGHLGHLPTAAAAGRRCACGGNGHVEAVASGPAMVAAYTERTGTVVALPDVGSAAAKGDDDAATVIAAGGAALGSALGGLVNVLDPDIVVIGGGVTGCGPAWWEAMARAAAEQVLPAVAGVRIVPASLGGDAALVGAGRMAWETLR